MSIIKGYCLGSKENGKYAAENETNRKILSSVPKADNYGAVLDDDIIRIDIDDYDHSSGKIVEPIRQKPRSDAVLSYLNSKNYNYVGIRTPHGIHILMRKPKNRDINSNKNGWYSALTVKVEYHVTKVFEPLVINRNVRQFIKGDLNSTVDELPAALFPIQKSKSGSSSGKTSRFDLSFEEGERNSHFSEYAFYLINLGFSAKDIKETIEAINGFVLEKPLKQSEIDTILRPETMEKLAEKEMMQKNGVVSPKTFAEFLKKIGLSLRYNELVNVVEYSGKYMETAGIKDRQNVMPIKLQHEYRAYTRKQNITKQQTIDLITLESDLNAYNPVRCYLSSVPWDNKDRFCHVYKALSINDETEKILIKKWFFQCAAMAFNQDEDPIQAEGVLILHGAEGIGKSRFFQKMAVDPQWFSSLDKELTTKNKDVLIQTLSVWIAEIGEIDRTFAANKSDVKSFITSRNDTIRKPYRSEPVTKARTTSFCGTTNKDVFLTDDSGFRRWWIVHVKNKINFAGFLDGEELRQFWAQCYYEVKNDPNCFRLTDAEMEAIKNRNKESTEMIPAEEELRNAFDFNAPLEKWIFAKASAIKAIPAYRVLNYSDSQIGKALRKIMGDDSRIISKRTHGVTTFFIPPAESEARDRFGNYK